MRITENTHEEKYCLRRVSVETDYGTKFEFTFAYIDTLEDATLVNTRVYYTGFFMEGRKSGLAVSASFAPRELERAQNMAVLAVLETLKA